MLSYSWSFAPTQNSWNVQCVHNWLGLSHLVNRDIDHGVWAVLEIFLAVPIANSVYLHRVDQLKRTKTRHISLGLIVGIRVVGLITKVIGCVSVMINLSDYLYILWARVIVGLKGKATYLHLRWRWAWTWSGCWRFWAVFAPVLTAHKFAVHSAYLTYMGVYFCISLCTPGMRVGGTTTLAHVTNSSISRSDAHTHCW